ncbi:MAG TPA: hypothetical protein DEP12_01730 [Planctomycetaceae bacterium]|nr:hypothetical protein [Planctomycetaceae bacterium]
MQLLKSATVLILLACCTSTQADDDAAGHAFFEKKIRPVLIRYCYECHGEEKQESDLRLDNYKDLMRGGGTGPAVVPENLDESLIIHVLRYEDEELQMPPEHKLADEVVDDFVKWIEMGAPHPDASKTKIEPRQDAVDWEKERNFWSFQPISDPEIPELTKPHSNWATNSLDHFILSKLQQQGLTPAPAADKITLIRRVTFALTGLPPTPEEVQAFLADRSENAYPQLIDRLLDSSAYGERWGRFWLDVVRYADSNGLDENIAHGNAWRYRDYVIQAFNDDIPFDEFIVEQIAGDLLPAAEDIALTNRRLVATGFLVLGPKVLAEGDEQKLAMDIVDEQIDTIGRAFMGMTIGCARCHDHKFDPISTEDYYALASIFKSTHTMESYKRIAKWNENEVFTPQSKAEYERYNVLLNEVQTQVNDTTEAAKQDLLKRLGVETLPEKPEEQFSEAYKKQITALKEQITKLNEERGEPPTAMGVREAEPVNLQVHIRGSHLSLGKQVTRRMPEVFLHSSEFAIPQEQSGRLQFAQWLTSKSHPLTARVLANRLWRWHFGKGIQESTDNFGNLGDNPVNPELLDHVAQQLIQNNWSIKDWHRWVMNSSTYKMSSTIHAQNHQQDPANAYLWRFPVRRLEAESIRDSILAVSGMLDREMGGSMLHVKNRQFLFDHTSKDLTDYSSLRRSIYLPVIRNNLYDVFQLFDFNDASVINGNRDSTTVAPQALFMMNSPLVEEASCQLAHQLTDFPEKQQISELYRLAYGRQPTKSETNLARKYLKQFLTTPVITQEQQDNEAPALPMTAEFQALKLLCHSVLASNEFIYIK